jgi:hypothetical protein
LKNVSRSRKWLIVFLFLQPGRAQIAAGFVIAVRTHAQRRAMTMLGDPANPHA